MTSLRVLLSAEVLKNQVTGVERYTAELIKALSRRDDLELTVLVTSRQIAETLPERIQSMIRPLTPWSGVLPWKSPDRKVFEPFDVVHCPTVRTPFFLRPKCAVVMTVHDLSPLTVPWSHTIPYRAFFRTIAPIRIREADALLSVSEATARDLTTLLRIPRERITVSPHGSRFSSASATFPKQRYFLAVGTREPRKNLAGVVAAYRLYRQRYPDSDMRLVIAGGSGWGESVTIDPLIKPYVDELGYTDDDALQGLYGNATSLIYPSFYEGFGLPVLEAMSLGCAVITSNVSSLPEVGGDAVLLVDPRSDTEICAAMERLAHDGDEVRRLADAGLLRAQKFSWDECAARAMTAYRQAMTTRNDRLHS